MKKEISVVSPEIREEHKMQFRSLLQHDGEVNDPYLESSFPVVNHPSFLKEEFRLSAFQKTKARLRRLLAASPFLKSPSEIRRELKEEAGKQLARFTRTAIDPLFKAMQRPLEENY